MITWPTTCLRKYIQDKVGAGIKVRKKRARRLTGGGNNYIMAISVETDIAAVSVVVDETGTMSSAVNTEFSAGRARADSANRMSPPAHRSRQQPGSACEECRRKRIRCDRGTPQCLACANSGTKCVVTTCAPRGPKKGHLRSLQKQIDEKRTEELENRLKNQRGDLVAVQTHVKSSSSSDGVPASDIDNESNRRYSLMEDSSFSPQDMNAFCDMPSWTPSLESLGMENLDPNIMFSSLLPDGHVQPDQPLAPLGSVFHPNGMICNDLDQLYFDRVHPFAPILQEPRYMSWSKRPDKTKPQMCLQYAMWTLASSLSTQFELERRGLYTEARQLLVSLEAENQANHISLNCVSIEQVQASILLVLYELTNTDCNYQRGILSAGGAFRLVQMKKLYEIDGSGATHSGSSPGGQADWVELESMRRTFWLAYMIDRFASAIDGLPLAFNERQIRTRLPAPEANFTSGRPITTCFLSEVMNGLDADYPCDNSSPFTTSIFIATLCGRALEHKHFLPYASQSQGIATYDYCHQFQSRQPLNALLSQHINLLSNHVSIASERPDPTLIFLALLAHMAVFILFETIESKLPQGAEAQSQETDALLVDYKQRSLNIVHNLEALTSILGNLNHFRVCHF
ncbi:putative Zn(II)2Cys6 transcription factor [Camillea tinctor]|nr:putative Zn(II)2Cys6 transcription factor [Camillea tinctor]